MTLTFVVGGAGAQKEIGVQILRSLRKKIHQKEIRLNLVAGTHPQIAEYFEQHIHELLLTHCRGKSVNVISGLSNTEYFKKFSSVLRTTDILWTKPSELSFYTALGLPLIIAPPIGAQEERNKKWLELLGTGFAQEDPEYTHDWLFDWLDEGMFAEAAWEGFTEAPQLGTYEVEKVVLEKKR